MQADTVGTSLACPKAGESRQRGLTRRRGTAFVCASAFAGWRGGRRRGRRRRIPPRELVGHHGRAGLRVPRSCGAAPVLPAAHDARPLPHHQGACSCWLFAVVPVAVVVVVVGVFVGSSFFSRRFWFVSMSAHGFETPSFVSPGWRVTMVRLLKTLVDTLLSSLSDPLFCCFFVSNLSLSRPLSLSLRLVSLFFLPPSARDDPGVRPHRLPEEEQHPTPFHSRRRPPQQGRSGNQNSVVSSPPLGVWWRASRWASMSTTPAVVPREVKGHS